MGMQDTERQMLVAGEVYGIELLGMNKKTN